MKLVPLDGQDVARLLQLRTYKWQYSLPKVAPGQKIMAVFWIEDWKRDDTKPVIHEQFASELSQRNDILLMKLPKSQEDSTVVATGGEIAIESGFLNPIEGVKGGSFTRPLYQEIVKLERDLFLVSMAHNDRSGCNFNPNTLGLPLTNDRTIFFKAHLTTGSKITPIWKNGQIVLQ